MFGYEIEYRNEKIENATVMEHVYATWVYIEGLNSEGAYEVHVRCVVMVQSTPLPIKFERDPGLIGCHQKDMLLLVRK